MQQRLFQLSQGGQLLLINGFEALVSMDNLFSCETSYLVQSGCTPCRCAGVTGLFPLI